MILSPKELIRSFADRNLEMQERLFRLLASIGLIGLLAGIIDTFLIGENIMIIISLIASFVFFLAVFYLSLRFRKIQAGAVIIAIAITCIVLPLSFLTTGDIFGGSPIWFLFGMVYVCLVVEGKVKYVFLALSVVIDAACYYIAYAYPEVTIKHEIDMAYIDSFVSLFIVSLLICGMILFQNRVFRSENSIAKQQKQEIEELNRAQNRFFSSMSHEIRTPINTIIGLNEMTLREDVSEEVAANAVNIQGAGKMLLNLINDFLDMSKIESGKMDIVPAPYDLGAMLSDIVNMVWVRANEKGLEFHINVDKTVPAQLIGDEVRVKQILINVLNNAVKYTKTGSVTLSVQSRSYGQDDDWVQMSFSVTDTGIGIKKENIPNLFNAFKRVDEKANRSIEGTGLGLAIVKQLIDLMGGDISVNSVYTKGSTFLVTLPQKAVGDTKIGNYDPGARHSHGTREHYRQSFEAPAARVLIVDDNETNLMVTAKLLRDTKIQTDLVTDGADCLERTLRSRYDVILMDHLMPGMDGIECFHAIRMQTEGLNQNTPVVILTANAGHEYSELYRRESFNGYLPKPVTGEQLEAELLRHLPKELVTVTGDNSPVGVTETPVVAYKKKLPVMISTESVCDLPKNLAKSSNIAVIPYRILTEKGEFLDGIEAETDGILSYISEKGKQVLAKEPAVKDYEEFFAEQLTKAQYIVHISLAKEVNSGYDYASEAAKAFENVIVVDSGHLSSGMGLMALQAARYAEEGMNAEAIAHEVELMKDRVRTSFVVSDTEYLTRTGMLSDKINSLCKALMIHPVLTMKKSRMKVGKLWAGTRDNARKKYISSALKGTIDTRTLFITYAGLSAEELEHIASQVKKKVEFQEVIYQKASPAVSTNCGPGAFGLLFMMK